MCENRPELFRGRHFRAEIIVLCIRWYLRYPLSYRNLEEMRGERGLSVDHSTIARWVLNTRRSSASGFDVKCVIPTGRGGLMKRTFVFPDIGHIYIGPSTQPATPLIFCSRRNGTESQQKPFSSLRCARLGSAGRA